MDASVERSHRERHACVFVPQPGALALSGTSSEGAPARPSMGINSVGAPALSTELCSVPVCTPQGSCTLGYPPFSLAGPERVLLRSACALESTLVDRDVTTLQDEFAYMQDCHSKIANYSFHIWLLWCGYDYVTTGGIFACMCLDLTYFLSAL